MNTHRRKFLKIVLIGSASFVVGRIFGPIVSGVTKLTENTENTGGRNDKIESLSQTDPGSFKVIEDKNFFSVYDESGEEVFQVDKSV